MSRKYRSWLAIAGCTLVALWPGSPAAAREKVDVVYLKNGDRITGEIISLEYGELRVSTDSMSKVAIEWPDVIRIVSPQFFVVEDDAGGRFYGLLDDSTTRNKLAVKPASGDGSLLEMFHVTRIAATEKTLLSRLDGSFAVGFDYTKASDITTLSGSANFSYRAPDFGWAIDLDAHSTKDPEQGTLDRGNVGFQYQWFRPNRLFWTGFASLERNEETGIEARLLGGAGIGRYFHQTARSEISAVVGLVALEEWATGTEGSQQSIEALTGATWRIFKFNTPKISLNSTLVLYHSLTESDRNRSKLNFSLRQEIISDLFIDLAVFHAYDTDPPDETAEKDDYGVTTSLGYSFN